MNMSSFKSLSKQLLFHFFVSFFLISVAQSAENSSIARAQFTTLVKDREPVNQVLIINNLVKRISFFSDIRNMEGRVITHYWKYNGKQVSQKEFKIEGPRWRIFSEIDLDPAMTGVWTVTIKDDKQWPLEVVMFKYMDKDDPDSTMMILPAK